MQAHRYDANGKSLLTKTNGFRAQKVFRGCLQESWRSEMSDDVVEVTFWPGSPVSYTTTKIELFFGSQPLSTGTGFVMDFAGEYGLVTNWHVLSGRSPIDEGCLSKTGGIPDRATFHVALSLSHEKDGRPAETLFFKPIDIPLFKETSAVTPVWIDARDREPQSDYAIIYLQDVVEELSDPAYSIRSIKAGTIALKKGVKPSGKVSIDDLNYIYPPVGHQVFIVGYPAGIEPSGVFPIWKGGTIASEPTSSVLLNGVEIEDVMFVDGLTRHGMSGAPVICQRKLGETYSTVDGLQIPIREEGPLFLGVYAGREGVTASEADLALGRVWKAEAVERLFADGLRQRANA